MQAEPTPGTVPVHHRIADKLRGQIASGELPPGAAIPTTRELQEAWGCTAITVRSAIAVLRSEGLITSGRGKAPVVREPMVRHEIQLSADWTNEQKALVLRPRAERQKLGAIELIAGIPIEDVISTHRYEIVPADLDIAQELGCELDQPTQRRTYEMVNPTSGHRVAFSISHIPLALIEGNPALLDDSNEPWPGGHQHQLYTVGIELERIDRTVIATEPTPADRQRWGMDLGSPLIKIRSRSVDTRGRVVEFSDATYPADRTQIDLTERLAPWPAGHAVFDLNEGDH